MTATIHGAEYDLQVVRLIRQRILDGDWTQGAYKDSDGKCCLAGHLIDVQRAGGGTAVPINQAVFTQTHQTLVVFNDTHTQAEVVALLDDVEDMLLGELG